MSGRKLTTKEVVERLNKVHDGQVRLDESTYVNTGIPCRFIDIVHGEFFNRPFLVFGGSGHKARSKDKRKETCRKKYGVDHVLRVDEFKKKNKQTCLKVYGTEYSSSSKIVRDKVTATFLKNYGVTSACKNPIIQAKVAATNLKRYGVRVPSQNEEIRTKMHITSTERYGTPSPLGSSIVRAKFDVPAIVKKRNQTMVENDSYNKSKPEDVLFMILCHRFGLKNVERQKLTNSWPIDFYIKNIDTYVQLDGEYWHGLDRSIEEIAEHKTLKDVAIHKKFFRDIEQNSWFKAQKMKLVRVTDKELVDWLKTSSNGKIEVIYG